MPRLAEDMSAGTILKWLRNEGQTVEKGEPLLEVETEKVNITVDSPGTGVLLRIIEPEGAEVAVGRTIAIIRGIDEIGAEAMIGPQEVSHGVATIPEPEPRPAHEMGRVRLSPGARRLVKKHDLDITKIRGTGPGGRIVTENVMGLLSKTTPLPVRVMRTVPMTMHRKTTAERMLRSWQTAAHATAVMEVDMTRVVQLREELRTKSVRISYTELVVMAVARALRQIPIMNSRLRGEEIELLEDVNIGIAVATEKGLVVPVVHDADKKRLDQIEAEVNELVRKAAGEMLSINDVAGGTFTISNFGMLGCDFGASIINPPQSALLGIGRIVERPVVVDGKIVARPMMHMCINFDHRVMDGADAARFLGALKKIFDNPSQLVTPG
jgi:pyruvate dehydrogenase E2 component (dihydrolipoamide acetyltransferase)